MKTLGQPMSFLELLTWQPMLHLSHGREAPDCSSLRRGWAAAVAADFVATQTTSFQHPCVATVVQRQQTYTAAGQHTTRPTRGEDQPWSLGRIPYHPLLSSCCDTPQPQPQLDQHHQVIHYICCSSRVTVHVAMSLPRPIHPAPPDQCEAPPDQSSVVAETCAT